MTMTDTLATVLPPGPASGLALAALTLAGAGAFWILLFAVAAVRSRRGR